MSIQTLTDVSADKSCLFDSVSEWAFGPLFDGDDGADTFLLWYNLHPDWPDLRALNDEQWRNLMDNYALSGEAPEDDDEDDEDTE